MAWRWQEYLLKKELQIKTNNDNATHFLKYKASNIWSVMQVQMLLFSLP